MNKPLLITVGWLSLIVFNVLHYFTRNMQDDFLRGAIDGVFLGIAAVALLFAARLNGGRRCAS